MKRSLNIPDYILNLAKELRKKQTDSEKILWECLRKRRFLGFKFRRQQPVGRYIVDFLCFEKKLVIEIDGPVHDDTKDYDKIKDEYLIASGFNVLRISSKSVKENLEETLGMIKDRLE